MKKLLYLIVFWGGAIISVMAYAASGDWVWYNFDANNELIVRPESAKSGNRKIPNGDCLEMICEHGCVENEEGIGYCSPNDGNTGDSCTVEEGIYADACCQSGVCEGGLCVSACADNTDCGGVGSGYYCHYDSNRRCVRDTAQAMDGILGTCQEIGDFSDKNIEGLGVLRKSARRINWWSAKNWCEAQKGSDGSPLKLIDISGTKLGCYKNDGTPWNIQMGSSGSFCCGPEGNCGNDISKQSSIMQNLRKAFGSDGNSAFDRDAWTDTDKNDCYAFVPEFHSGQIEGATRNGRYFSDNMYYGVYPALCETGKTSSCPPHSSTTVREGAQIGITGCYCEEGYMVNETDDGCDPIEGKICSDWAKNSDCGGVGSGYYCKFPVISNSFAVTAPSTTCVQPQNGVCTKIPETRKIENFTTLKSILTDAYMDWYSANNLCQALGLSLVQAHDLCTDEEYETVLHAPGDCGSEAGYRHCNGWKFPKDAGGVNRFWTATPSKYFDCSMWAISLANGDLVPCYNRSSNANLARPLCK